MIKLVRTKPEILSIWQLSCGSDTQCGVFLLAIQCHFSIAEVWGWEVKFLESLVNLDKTNEVFFWCKDEHLGAVKHIY